MKENYFPEQRTSRSRKQEKEWYTNLATYILGQINTTHANDIQDRLDSIDGIISDSYYKKVLNPYNATDPKFTRWPAEMRNYDIMKDVIRRYMGEYAKQPFDFQVKVNDPDVITRFNAKFNAEITNLAIQMYINNLNQMGVNTGQPNQEIPDFNKFYEDFKRDYMDDVAIQGQEVLTALIDWTESNLKYYKSFYDYIVLGQTYTYRDIRNGQLYKEVVNAKDIYPISNGNAFVEDHDKVVRRFSVTIPELLENFTDVIDEDTYNKIKDLFKNHRTTNGGVLVPLALFKSRLDEKQYTTFTHNVSNRIEGQTYRLTNEDNEIEGYHIVWTTEVQVHNVTYIDPVTGTPQEDIIETDSFDPNNFPGLISHTPEWINEVWEMYQFGTIHDDILTKPRPIAYQRRDGNNVNRCKLCYNGISEVVPGTGFTFSIPDAILPFQIARNIFSFYREKIIAKNKDKILVVPDSLLGDKSKVEDKIYRLEASSIFSYDDSEDDSGQKANYIKVLDASLSQFIGHITELIDRMKEEAWDTVDMNPQRYGDIANSAGKGTTEEAIVRSSMGSVILFTMFEKFLEKEYVADLEYSKVAYVEGKQGSYSDLEGNTRFLDLDVDKHILANYGCHVVSSVTQAEQKRKLEGLALAAAQNGQFQLGIDAILGKNVASIKKAFSEFAESEREYQRSIATEKEQIIAKNDEANRQNDDANRQNEMDIAILKEQGDTEREIIKAQSKILELQSNIINAQNDGSTSADAIADFKNTLEQEKVNLQRMKQDFEERKHRDNIQVKREDMASKERIARQNKNRYDTKK